MLHTTMKSSLLLFCILVYVCTHASQTDLDEVCTEPFPVVENAAVSEEFVGHNYTDGSLLPFSCKIGYASAGRTTYTCSKTKWVRVSSGKCVPRPCELPEDIPNGSYDIVEGNDLVFGSIIKYTCNEGYQMVSRFDTRVCMLDGWSNSLPVCEVVTCGTGANPGLKIIGLPEDHSYVSYGFKLQFECSDSGMVLRGQREVTCTSGGQWSHSFPQCEVVTCNVRRMHYSVTVRGVPSNGELLKYGQKLYFTCAEDGMVIKGEREVTCTSSGEWSAPFPKCEEITCPHEEIHQSVDVKGLPTGNGPVTHGTKLNFRCTNPAMVLHGAQVVTCMKDGRWSSSFPRCGIPDGSCGPPPSVEFGDVQGPLKEVYSYMEWVRFKCQRYYILDSSWRHPEYMQCKDGRWYNNSLKCRKPCIIKTEDLDIRNIAFKHPRDDLRYIEHRNRVTFICKSNTRANANTNFVQYCLDGHMDFPECRVLK